MQQLCNNPWTQESYEVLLMHPNHFHQTAYQAFTQRRYIYIYCMNILVDVCMYIYTVAESFLKRLPWSWYVKLPDVARAGCLEISSAAMIWSTHNPNCSLRNPMFCTAAHTNHYVKGELALVCPWLATTCIIWLVRPRVLVSHILLLNSNWYQLVSPFLLLLVTQSVLGFCDVEHILTFSATNCLWNESWRSGCAVFPRCQLYSLYQQ